MNYIAGSVMLVLFLAACAAGIGGLELVTADDPALRAAYLVPAIALWLISLMALTGLGVIAAILATRPVPGTAAAGRPLARRPMPTE